MSFEPEPLPGVSDTVLADWVERQLREISAVLGRVENVQLTLLHVEPDKPRDGMLALADGVNWNPGSGAGFYGYRAGVWVFLE